MKSFREFFPITAFRGVVLYDVLNPRVDGKYEEPAVKAWYTDSHDNWHKHCDVPIESFIREVVESGVLKPISNQSGRDNYVSAQWERLLGGVYEPESLLSKTYYKFLYQALTIARYQTDRSLDRQYDDLITLVDSGTIEWSLTDISSDCDRTGQHMWLDILNWEPRWGAMDASRNFQVLSPLPADDNLRTIEVSFPSGRLLTNDWFRVDGFNEIVESSEWISINTSFGQIRQTEHYASNHNFVNIFAGDMGVHPFSKDDDEVTSYLVFNRGDGTTWDSETDEETEYEGDGFDHGSICTDLWAASVIDYEVLVSMLTPTHGSQSRAVVDAWIADEMYGPEITVEPGRYLCRYSPNYTDFVDVAKEKGFDVFSLDEPIFTLTRIGDIV